MRTIRFFIPRSATLAQINVAISDQESLSCKFLDSKVAYHEGDVVNVLTFEMFDVPTMQKPLLLVERGAGQPPNSSKEWEGVMCVEGGLKVIVGYRNN